MKNPILEYTPKGWIKLHRELEGKGIFKEPDLLQLYIYLMFHAMTEDIEYRGIIISRGQLALTYGSLSKTLNISQRRVRTLLGKLVLAQELACSRAYSGAHSFTIVTICNYDKYQGTPKGKRLNSQPIDGHDERHCQAVSSLYNDKERLTKEVDKKSSDISAPSSEFEKILIENLISDEEWKAHVAKDLGINMPDLIKLLDIFFSSNLSRGKLHTSITDLKSHFIDWHNIYLKKQKENEKTGPQTADRRRGIDPGAHSAEDYDASF